jgi:threonine dehydratase
MRLPVRSDVVEAAARIVTYAQVTPLIQSDALNAAVGGRVLLKLEVLQRVGAFKFRGAYNAIAQVSATEFPGGIVACSSGNHAQGVAAAAAICGHAATVIMPSDAPKLKIDRTRGYGATVITYDREREDRNAIATSIAERERSAFVPPFDHCDVIAGQGTTGLELMAQAATMGAHPEAILVPCSGGGLVSGIALAVSGGADCPRVYAVEPTGFDDFGRSLDAGSIQHNARMSGSICDALLSPAPGTLTFALAQQFGIAAVNVDDNAVRDAMRFAFRELKLVLEPGGAIALAAVLTGKITVAGRTVAVVLSGGNVDPVQFAGIIST